LAHRHLERDAGARRRLLEDHRQGLAGERPGAAAAALLEGDAHVEDVPELGRVETVEIEEMPRRRPAGAGNRPQRLGGPAHVAKLRATRSTMATASSTWVSSMISGGSTRMTFSPAPTVSSPCSCSRAMT